VLDEASQQGTGVLADLALLEQSTEPATRRGIRVVTIRTGIVLAAPGARTEDPCCRGAIFKLGLGARLGDGRQWTSWVALDDEVAIILRAIDDTRLSGPVNSTAPNPVRNAELTHVIANALGRQSRLAVPATVLRLALGRGAADELLLASQRVLPQKLADAGYVHAYAELRDALAAALAPRRHL